MRRDARLVVHLGGPGAVRLGGPGTTLDEAQLWACVDDKVIPDRGGAPRAPEQAIPAAVVFQLINAVGVPEHEVMLMTRGQATARLNDHWANPPA